MFAFLTTTAPTGVQVMTDIANYLDFVLLLFFAFGIAFEMPSPPCCSPPPAWCASRP